MTSQNHKCIEVSYGTKLLAPLCSWKNSNVTIYNPKFVKFLAGSYFLYGMFMVGMFVSLFLVPVKQKEVALEFFFVKLIFC